MTEQEGKKGRTLTWNDVNEMSRRIQTRRLDFKKEVEAVIGDLDSFIDAVTAAIGEISIDEAKQALIEFFAERVRHIR